MKKTRPRKSDDLKPEYDFAKLGPAIRGKYYKRLVGKPMVVELRPSPDTPKPKKARKRVVRRVSRTK